MTERNPPQGTMWNPSSNTDMAQDKQSYSVEEMLDPPAELLENCPLSFIRASRFFALELRDEGDYVKSLSIISRLLGAQDRIWGTEHIEYLRNIYVLALIHQSLRNFENSARLLEDLLTTRKRVLGPHHWHTLNTMTTLAELYRLLDREDEAEELYNEALPFITEQKGPDNPVTLITLNNLGLLYKSNHRIAEACALFEKALAGLEGQRTPSNLDLLSIMQNLAETYNCLGKTEDAETMFQRALTGRVKYWGSEHPATLATMVTFAAFCDENGRYGNSHVLWERVLEARKRQLGRCHRLVLTAQYDLGFSLLKQYRYGEALEVGRALVAGLEENYREIDVNSDVASATDVKSISLGTRIMWQQSFVACLLHTKRNDEAETLQQKLLPLLESQHEDSAMNDLYAEALLHMAIIRKRQSRHDESEALLRKALALPNLNESSTEYTECQNLLISLLGQQKRHPEAEPLLQSSLSGKESVYGRDSLEVASSLVRLGFLYEDLHRWDDAEDVMTKALCIHEQILGKEHNETSVPLQAIGLCKEQKKDYALGVDAWEGALPLMGQNLGRNHEDTLWIVERMVNALRHLGRNAEVGKWLAWAKEGKGGEEKRWESDSQNGNKSDDDGIAIERNKSTLTVDGMGKGKEGEKLAQGKCAAARHQRLKL